MGSVSSLAPFMQHDDAQLHALLADAMEQRDSVMDDPVKDTGTFLNSALAPKQREPIEEAQPVPLGERRSSEPAAAQASVSVPLGERRPSEPAEVQVSVSEILAEEVHDAAELVIFPPDTMLIPGLPDVPDDHMVTYTINEAGTRRQVVQRDDDLLTPQQVKEHWKEVEEAMIKELQLQSIPQKWVARANKYRTVPRYIPPRPIKHGSPTTGEAMFKELQIQSVPQKTGRTHKKVPQCTAVHSAPSHKKWVART